MDELYRVTLAFKSVEDCELPTPFDAGQAVRVDRDGGDYLAQIEVMSATAQEALEGAERTLRDLLACFAARAAPYVVVHDTRRNVKLVDPAPVTDGPIPPFQSVGGVVTNAGAEILDPTGELRRQRRVMNLYVDASVKVGDVSQQAQWFESRHLWDERLRRAMTVFHAAESSVAPEVRFVLIYCAFEILTSRDDRALLSLRTPNKRGRKKFLDGLRVFIESAGYESSDAQRWVNSVRSTHAVSPVDLGVRYVISMGESSTPPELKWLRDQRGAYVHTGDFDRGAVAAQRRENFRQLVRRLIQWELKQVTDLDS